MKKRAIIYIILAGILWGTSGIFVHYLTPYGFTSLQMTGIRAIVSFICISVYTLIKDKTLFRTSPRDLLLFAAIGASLFLTAGSYYTSIQMTSVTTAVVLMYTSPLYVTLFSSIFWKERLTVSKTVSIVLMLIGCALVSGIIGGLKFDAVGVMIGALSGIAYAAYNILTKKSAKSGLSPLTVTLYSFAFMSLISLPALEPTKALSSIAVAPAVTLPLLIGLGVCTFVLPYFLYTLAMNELSASTASALGIVEPMSATLFSVIIFSEPLDLPSITGAILIVAAILMIAKSEGSATCADDSNNQKDINACIHKN